MIMEIKNQDIENKKNVSNNNSMEPTITLCDGRTLTCYPKNAIETEPTDNSLKLDTTGQYLVVGNNKPTVRQKPDTEQEKAEQFFLDHAFFFLRHSERILNDSRMFLAPVPVQSGLAYTGESGFRRPTLGVYIEWWHRCHRSILCSSKDNWLVYHIAGSPLSGANHCGVVNIKGKRKTVCLPSPFIAVWESFCGINRRYDNAKDLYEAYSLEKVAELLEIEDNSLGGNNIIAQILQKENLMLRNELKNRNGNSINSKEKMRRALLKAYFESKREILQAWLEKRNAAESEKERNLAKIEEQQHQLKQALRNGQIDNITYQKQLTPLNKRGRDIRLSWSKYDNQTLQEVIPELCNKDCSIYFKINDVLSFFNGKL